MALGKTVITPPYGHPPAAYPPLLGRVLIPFNALYAREQYNESAQYAVSQNSRIHSFSNFIRRP